MLHSPETLLARAAEARKLAYAPYSHFCVGAALLAENGEIFTGCNIENGAFAPSLCAERVAFAKAVSTGARTLVAIAVVGGPEGTPAVGITPCGVCLQTMSEFCKASTFLIYTKGENGSVIQKTLSALLPDAFTFDRT